METVKTMNLVFIVTLLVILCGADVLVRRCIR